MTSIEVETAEVEKAFADYAKTSRRDIATLLKEQAGILVKEIALFTPPGRIDGDKPKSNRSGGERTIKNDLYKIMKPSRAKDAKTNPEFYHQKFRRYRGRVLTKLKTDKRDNRFRIEAATFKQYLAKVQARVGYMAAGWNNAAKWLGKGLPDWISRHNAPGKGSLIVMGDDITVQLTNSAVYPQSRGLMDRVVSRSLVERKVAMRKRVNNYLRELAQKTGLAA